MAFNYHTDADEAPCGLLTYDHHGIIRTVNRSMIKMLRYDQKEDLEGQHIDALLTVAGKIFYQTHFFPTLRLNGSAEEIFFNLKKNGGGELPVICNAVLSGEPAAAVIHCAFFAVPERGKYEQQLIDARRAAEQALRENKELNNLKEELELRAQIADRRVSRLLQVNDDIIQFSGIISHDLQESIRKIALYADLVRSEQDGTISSLHVQRLERITMVARSLRDSTTVLERFISLNIISEKPVLLSLNDLIRSSFTRMQAVTARHSSILKMPALPAVECFEQQLTLLFDNLFSYFAFIQDPNLPLQLNIDAAITERNSYRSARQRFNYVNFLEICITDHSPSATVDNFDNILILQHDFKKRTYESLNMAFCKKIVDNHYGYMEAGKNESGGLEVKIFLPLKQIAED